MTQQIGASITVITKAEAEAEAEAGAKAKAKAKAKANKNIYSTSFTYDHHLRSSKYFYGTDYCG